MTACSRAYEVHAICLMIEMPMCNINDYLQVDIVNTNVVEINHVSVKKTQVKFSSLAQFADAADR